METKYNKNQFGYIGQQLKKAMVEHKQRDLTELETSLVDELSTFLSNCENLLNKENMFHSKERIIYLTNEIFKEKIQRKTDKLKQELAELES